jgi:hypothetical protein
VARFLGLNKKKGPKFGQQRLSLGVIPMKNEQLPDEIRYLQPFVRWLGKRPPGRLNEDVDSSRLEKTLRNRIRGLPSAEAQKQLDTDRRALELWLKASAPEGHPAHWVLGFLMHPGLARKLLNAGPEKPPEPVIHFEPPEGWNVRAIPFNLNLRKGKVRAFITAINEFSFRNLQVPGSLSFTSGEGSVKEYDVVVGESKGKKYLRIQTAPVPGKQINYVLAVPGGFVSIMLCHTDGRDFDELPFEVQLQTLRIQGTG